MSFARPLALVALAAVPVLVWLYTRRERHRDRAAARFGNPALLPNLIDRSPGVRRHLPVAILLVALAALIVGVARPHATVTVQREEATVVFVVDVSRSMKAQDVQPTRLAAARQAVEELAAKVPSSYRLALVTFGSRAAVALPPTQDRTLFAKALQTLHPGQGTALGDGVALAVRIGQRERTSDGKVPPESVLVVSDGAAEGGAITPDKAIQQAHAAHVPVSALVIGTPGGVVQATLPNGMTATIQVPADPEQLRKVATGTAGQFYTSASDPQLRNVYGRLHSQLGSRKTSRELTDAFAGGGMVLLLLGGGLSATWFRRVP